MRSSKPAVFFDSYEDFKRVSEKVENEQAEFVAVWPPPESKILKKRPRDSSTLWL
jgi:hypothetical protein